MFETLIAAVIAFVSTNIDDLVINMLLFAGADDRKGRSIATGKYLGIGVLLMLSMLGACGLQRVPTRYLGLLGLVPIALGMKEWLAIRRQSADKEETLPSKSIGALGVMTVTLANGADNIGVYIPLFSGYGVARMALTAIVFALLTGVWCLIGQKLSALPALRTQLSRYKRILVPVVFSALGIYIILKSYLPV